MSTNVIMPALGMAQETGTIIRWLKAEGSVVNKDEPIMEIETDKVTVEIDAPASGVLRNVTADEGDVVPVGQVVALIVGAGESEPTPTQQISRVENVRVNVIPKEVGVSPVAARMIAEHGIELSAVKPEGGHIRKKDVAAFLTQREEQSNLHAKNAKLVAASPKARVLAMKRGVDLATIIGSGPEGAVLAADVPMIEPPFYAETTEARSEMGNIWRVMVERTTHSWTTVPHFSLMREVRANKLSAWRTAASKQTTVKVTYTDLLIKLLALSLSEHPQLNARWDDGSIRWNQSINIGIAVSNNEGLIVPVVHDAHTLKLPEIAERREELVARARAGELSPAEISGGTFTISNLGMYGVDQFNAVINPPQAGILAVGRIADRVVPVNGVPKVVLMATFVLSCDHRIIDGARAARFLETLSRLIEEPLTAL